MCHFTWAYLKRQSPPQSFLPTSPSHELSTKEFIFLSRKRVELDHLTSHCRMTIRELTAADFQYFKWRRKQFFFYIALDVMVDRRFSSSELARVLLSISFVCFCEKESGSRKIEPFAIVWNLLIKPWAANPTRSDNTLMESSVGEQRARLIYYVK